MELFKKFFENDKGISSLEVTLVSILIVFAILLGVVYYNENYSYTNEIHKYQGEYSLINVDGYYVGRIIDNNTAYYTFQINADGRKTKFFKVPVDKAQIKQSNEPFVKISSNVCVIYIPNPDKIKDYGIVSKKESTTFIPIFIYR
ncbi:hypothetical protein V7D15_07045 [Thermoanaerobacter thermohydrosulfuricus]